MKKWNLFTLFSVLFVSVSLIFSPIENVNAAGFIGYYHPVQLQFYASSSTTTRHDLNFNDYSTINPSSVYISRQLVSGLLCSTNTINSGMSTGYFSGSFQYNFVTEANPLYNVFNPNVWVTGNGFTNTAGTDNFYGVSDVDYSVTPYVTKWSRDNRNFETLTLYITFTGRLTSWINNASYCFWLGNFTQPISGYFSSPLPFWLEKVESNIGFVFGDSLSSTLISNISGNLDYQQIQENQDRIAVKDASDRANEIKNDTDQMNTMLYTFWHFVQIAHGVQSTNCNVTFPAVNGFSLGTVDFCEVEVPDAIVALSSLAFLSIGITASIVMVRTLFNLYSELFA